MGHVGAFSFPFSLPRSRRFSLAQPFSVVAAMSDDPIRAWILTEGKATQITRISPIGGGCVSHASRYDTDSGPFFVKTNSELRKTSVTLHF
uniref:Protein-ribulosamine 3-kinase, chloroplastic n=1 Tax=Elaeis guineensis var. tenera TaxID=51953 RepID=A0A6I9QMY3_ELAGV|nr:protein-ribulosamine 3-kinase, chloroplastic [Elaeis guineensis]